MESIYEYRDYRLYLKDHYNECASRNSRFSLRSFALKAELNVSNLTRILKGERNISEATTERLITLLKLRDREASYFRLLVQYNQARSQSDKTVLYEQIRLFRKTRLRGLGSEHDEYFTSWYNIALRELINVIPSKMKPAGLARLLQPSPSPNEIRKSLNLLLRLGLVKRNEDGTLELSERMLTTSDDWTGTAIHSFQIAMAELGKQALDRFPKNDRNISTFTFSLSSEGFAKAVQVLRRAQQELAEIAESDQDPDRVYHLNVQLFPLSRSSGEVR